jgi:hypothetical protein
MEENIISIYDYITDLYNTTIQVRTGNGGTSSYRMRVEDIVRDIVKQVIFHRKKYAALVDDKEIPLYSDDESQKVLINAIYKDIDYLKSNVFTVYNAAFKYIDQKKSER